MRVPKPTERSRENHPSQMESNKLRSLCPALQNKTYFNYGGQGPLPSPSLEAITASWSRIQELGPFTADVWPYIGTEVNSTRRLLAQCCGVPAHRLALTENVTTGCVLPLWGLPFAEGDRLLIGDCEHPGVVSACIELARRQNLAIDVLKVKHLRGDQAHCDAAVIEAIAQALTPRTRLVVLSHLLWNTGQVMPIAAVAKQLKQHPQQPFLLVDAAQSFGQIPLEDAAAAADIYAFTGHKWACGPEGLGGVALSERVVSEAAPTVIGWRSLRDESKADLSGSDLFHHDSRRFEVATSCVPLMAGLRCSLQLLDKQGTVQQRWDRIRTLSGSLWQALQELESVTPLLNVAPASGLVSFQITGNVPPVEHVKQLGAQGLWIRDLADPSCLRACTHISTTEDDINTLVAAISAL